MSGTLRRKILENVGVYYEGLMAKAETNIAIYLENPAGIGEHSDVVGAIDCELTKWVDAKEKLSAVSFWK